MMLYIAIQTPVTKLINISNDMNILVYFPTTSRLSKENIIFNNLELDLRTKERPSQIKYESFLPGFYIIRISGAVIIN